MKKKNVCLQFDLHMAHRYGWSGVKSKYFFTSLKSNGRREKKTNTKR